MQWNKLEADLTQNPILKRTLEDFVYLESLRLYRGLRLSLVQSFKSKEVLTEYIEGFK